MGSNAVTDIVVDALKRKLPSRHLLLTLPRTREPHACDILAQMELQLFSSHTHHGAFAGLAPARHESVSPW
jgi:hypothetical protein